MNDINSISPNIRDFLLSKNLTFSDTITNNNLEGLAVGIGYPAEISSNTIVVLPSVDIISEGELYRNTNILNNPYASSVEQLPTNITSDNILSIGNLPLGVTQREYLNNIGSTLINSPFSKSAKKGKSALFKNKYVPDSNQTYQVGLSNNTIFFENQIEGGYLDNQGEINGIENNQLIDTVSGLLTGATTLDIRSSLASRVLSGIGVTNDTQLGKIGNRELLKSLKNKIKANGIRESLGKLNLNPISLLSGGDLFIPDYSITVAKETKGKILDVALNILGVERPVSIFEAESTIFNYELFGNGVEVDNFSRAMSQIKNTGKGQMNQLFSNMKATMDPKFTGGGIRYSPGYDDSDRNEFFKLEKNEYPTRIGDYYNDEKSLPKYGEDVLNWYGDGNKGVNTLIGGDLEKISPFPIFDDVVVIQDSLMSKTKQLFNEGKIKSIVTNKGFLLDYENELDSSVEQNGNQYISKGSGVKYIDVLTNNESNPNNIFCRSWVGHHGYTKVNRLQGHGSGKDEGSGLSAKGGFRTQNTSESVLDSNGFVKIAPYKSDNSDVKKYMFSLENLAWGNDLDKLPKNEIGNGDLLTGTKGRIMWFPPYDLTFSEGVSVNIESTNFIGRGEPVYTYNNTERTGNLSFKVLMDHPNYLNDLKENKDYDLYFDDLYNSIVAGCGEIPDPNLSQDEVDKIKSEVSMKIPQVKAELQVPPTPFKFYFPNDVASIFNDYEILGNEEAPYTTTRQTIPSEGYTAKTGKPYDDRKNYGLNKYWNNPEFIAKMKNDFNEVCPSCKVIMNGYASIDGKAENNKKLSVDRVTAIKKWFLTNIIGPDTQNGEARFLTVEGKGQIGVQDGSPVDSLEKKTKRYVNISFQYDPKIDENNKKEYLKKVDSAQKKALGDKIKARFFNEAMYFEKLQQEDNIVYETLKEKIKYFHPTFHSITPEGFNSRLTFLHQCTRQGSTLNTSGRPNNMSFGIAPVCILRLGDFYHTKIMIDSLNIDYDNQWDLNPEGVGIQPMIANVSLSFKFMGGQSMHGPINRLQNAISFNFFANTEIYDPRADKIIVDGGKGKYVKGDNKVDDFIELSANDSPGKTSNLKEGDSIQDFISSEEKIEKPKSTDVSKFTGISLISSKETDTSVFEIAVKFDSINMVRDNEIILSDEVMLKIAQKGFKISLTSSNSIGNVQIRQEIVGKAGIVSGLLQSYIIPDIILDKGSYDLSLIYGGEKIKTIKIDLG